MGKKAIIVSDISKLYGNKNALDNVALTVDDGRIFGLLGHNGAGKTTLVSILTTLLKPSSGRASIYGKDIIEDGDKVRRLIGYLPENVQFYDNLTLIENLTFFARLSSVPKPEKRINEVLGFLSFTEHKDEKLATFSKGMRQRVGIAQAILHKPKILFLDEPTSGLDPQGVKLFRELVISLNKQFGMTIFMNTHLLSEVTKTCTDIGVLRSGRLIYTNSLRNTLHSFPSESSLEDIYLKIESEQK